MTTVVTLHYSDSLLKFTEISNRINDRRRLDLVVVVLDQWRWLCFDQTIQDA